MKIEMEPTAQLVEVVGAGGGSVPARVWKGRTGNGLEVQVLVTQVAALATDDNSELELALREVRARPPEPERLAFPLAFPARLVL